LVKYLWKIPDYHVSIAAAASDPGTFLKFVNALVNDAIFLLDESLSKLSDIRNYQIEMQDRATWAQQEPVSASLALFLSVCVCVCVRAVH
jgi:ubiquitin conjugation factor E4 B